MENTFEFKFYPHDFVLGYWPHILVYHFAPGFIDVWDYIGKMFGFIDVWDYIGDSVPGSVDVWDYIGGFIPGFNDAWEYIGGYIGSFIDNGDEGHYTVESGPVWS